MKVAIEGDVYDPEHRYGRSDLPSDSLSMPPLLLLLLAPSTVGRMILAACSYSLRLFLLEKAVSVLHQVGLFQFEVRGQSQVSRSRIV